MKMAREESPSVVATESKEESASSRAGNKSAAVRSQFKNAGSPFILDQLLMSSEIYTSLACTNEGCYYGSDLHAALHNSITSDNGIDNLRYLLTLSLTYSEKENPQFDINIVNDGGYGSTLLRTAVSVSHAPHYSSPFSSPNFDDKVAKVKILLDFNANRSIKSKNETPLERARRLKSLNYSEADAYIKLLDDYFPSEEDMLLGQLECKIRIDALFRRNGRKRFMHEEIDAKFDPLWNRLPPLYRNFHNHVCEYSCRDALVDIDKQAILRAAILGVKMPFVLYFVLKMVESDLLSMDLLDCFCDRIRHGFDNQKKHFITVMSSSENCLNITTNEGLSIFDLLQKLADPLAFDLIEKLLLIGLNPSPQILERTIYFNNCGNFISEMKSNAPSSVAYWTQVSRILLVIKIMNLSKSLYLDEDSTYDLIQTLMLEELANPELEQPERLVLLKKIRDAENLALRERLALSEVNRRKAFDPKPTGNKCVLS